METYTIAIFGEAERGEYRTAYFCQTLEHLDQFFGNPPQESRGLYYAVQALLFKRDLIFIRVSEEGYSTQDYFTGIKQLEYQNLIPQLHAICTPGVGNIEIIDALSSVCEMYHCILVTNESDFYDYLTFSQKNPNDQK